MHHSREVVSGPGGDRTTTTRAELAGLLELEHKQKLKGGELSEEVKLDLGTAEFQAGTDGAASVAPKAGPFAKARAFYKPEKAVFGGEVEVKVHGVKGMLGAEAKTVTPAEIHRIAGDFIHHRDSGLDALTPLVRAARGWTELSEGERSLAIARGYTAESWADDVATQRQLNQKAGR